MCNHCEEDLSKFSEEEQTEIKAIGKQIDEAESKYATEYEALAKESEKLFELNEALEKKYEELDEKAGVNKLYEKLNEYYEGLEEAE